jgi:Integrase core domain
VGWAMATHMRTELILDALAMAYRQRRPNGVTHHSDQGTQYKSIAFGIRCGEWGIRPSMGSVGDCYDNAMCESFFATLECELLARKPLRNPHEAELAVFQFIVRMVQSTTEAFRDRVPLAQQLRTALRAAARTRRLIQKLNTSPPNRGKTRFLKEGHLERPDP